jgi:hypothetical protein
MEPSQNSNYSVFFSPKEFDSGNFAEKVTATNIIIAHTVYILEKSLNINL